MYKNNFVVAIKCNDKILREQDGKVVLPFGSEYSILMKNLNSERAVVSVYVDGEDATGCRRIVVNSNSETELEGFKKNSEVRNKFKFIKKTEKISKHRGDRIDDGLIRVEFTFEKPEETYSYTDPYPFDYSLYKKHSYSYDRSCYSLCCNTGITVDGSETRQNFIPVSIKELETKSNVIVIKLTGSDYVEEPITTKDKLECKTCGTKVSSKYKFCPECGTFIKRK